MNKKDLKECPECEQNRESGMNFCAFCGREILSARAEPKQEENREEIYKDLALFFNNQDKPWESEYFRIYKALKENNYTIIKKN